MCIGVGMKFADKLFLAVTALLTCFFVIFSIWLLVPYFQRILNREIAENDMRSQMFQYLFEMSYNVNQEYGAEFALTRAVEAAAKAVEEDEVQCLAFDETYEIYRGTRLLEKSDAELVMTELVRELTDTNMYVYCIRSVEDKKMIFHLSRIQMEELGNRSLYLGCCKDLTSIYEDRDSMINQYRILLTVLLLAGGGSVYLLSRYITRPIRRLEQTAAKIGAGDYKVRSDYHKEDEVGALADSFNRMADALVEHMRQKELEAKQKEDFTSAFAHELKTPLTSIIGYADMLNTIDLTEEERREAYYYIYSQGRRLERLSYKLLELSCMEHQAMQIKPIKTQDIAENLKNTLRMLNAGKNIRWAVKMEKGVIYGDFELLLSLFYNLLDNAVKAVEEDGFVLLRGSRTEEGYEMKVVDNGRGIPKEEISRVTEAFYMVDKSRSRKEGGAGIGMALCHKIIFLHHGKMQIVSNSGEGTVIQLSFPKEWENDERYK